MGRFLIGPISGKLTAGRCKLKSGKADGVFGKDSKLAHAQLEELGSGVEWHEYPMLHQVVPQKIQAIHAWIAQVLPEPRLSR